MRSHLFGHTADDLLVLREEIVTAHARLARKARGDDHDVRARGLLVTVSSDHVCFITYDRSRLVEVKCLPLWHSLDDVHQHHVGVIALCKTLCSGRTHIACTDYRNLVSH